MSYTKGVIERYGDAIEDVEQRRQFKEKVAGIEFMQEGARQICTGREVRRVLAGTDVEHLADDFARKFVKFLLPEDLGRG